MSRTVLALLCFLSVTESLNICIENTFAFLVFRRQLFSMKRSYYLVLNLASAPLFVGVTHPISLIKKEHFPFLCQWKRRRSAIPTLATFFQVYRLFSYTSIIFFGKSFRNYPSISSPEQQSYLSTFAVSHLFGLLRPSLLCFF